MYCFGRILEDFAILNGRKILIFQGSEHISNVRSLSLL